MKKKYIALLSILVASTVVAASFAVGYSAWQYAKDDREAEPEQQLFSIQFKTSSGSAISPSIDYTGLEFDSYFELPHRTNGSQTFSGWSRTQGGSVHYNVDTIYKYSDIYKVVYSGTWSTYPSNSITLYEVWSA